MVLHKSLAIGDIHIPYQWSYADATARGAATGFVASDVGKLARQLDNNSLWMLSNHSPIVWKGVSDVLHASTHQNSGGDEVATATAAVNAIPKANASAKLDVGWVPTGSSSTTVCIGDDSRLSNARTPTSHASSHNAGGGDALAIDAVAGTGSLRTLGTAATAACAGNDARLSDARTPAAHSTSHKNGGSDEVATATAANNAIPKAGGTGKLDIGWVPTGSTSTTVCVGNDSRLSNARTPTSHASSHNAGGGDALAIDAVAGTGSLRTLGTAATAACAGNDSRLSDSRTPTAHASSHNAGGGDALAIDSVAETGSLRTLGTSATSACAGNDSRLSDSRTDSNAIHKTTSAEISALTEKTTLVSTDVFVIEDSAASYAKKKVQVTNLPGGVDTTAIHKATSAEISAMTEKTTPIAADLLVIEDSAASNAKKKVQIGNVLNIIVFGKDYQTAVADARTTTTSATFQNKTTLTTGALTGTYRVAWTAVLDIGTTKVNAEAQLYNTTDSAILGAVQVLYGADASDRKNCGGFAEVTFAGAAKTFYIQYRSVNGVATVGIQAAKIELWRVA